MVAGLAACAPAADSGSGGGEGGLIGVAMPTKSSERWIADGNALKETLEGQGFTVDLQYAEDDIPTQVSQIENMITKGAEALIIASIDGTTLSQVLQDAADAEIPVIAYDRLIRDSENVDYYASFDNFTVGQHPRNIDFDCYRELIESFEDSCFEFDSYSMKYMGQLVQECEGFNYYPEAKETVKARFGEVCNQVGF